MKRALSCRLWNYQCWKSGPRALIFLSLLTLTAHPVHAESAWTASGWAHWNGSRAFDRPMLGVLVSVSDENGQPVSGLELRNFRFEYYTCRTTAPQCMYVNAKATVPSNFSDIVPGVYELYLEPCCGERGYFTTDPVVARVYSFNSIAAVSSGTKFRIQRAQAFLQAAPVPVITPLQ